VSTGISVCIPVALRSVSTSAAQDPFRAMSLS
jgi:hypothetical protein